MADARQHQGRKSARSGEERRARWSVYGDLWTRYLNWGITQHAWYLHVIHTVFYTFFFLALCRIQRRAVQRNAAVLWPGRSRTALFGDALAVFWNFAWATIDTARNRIIPGEIEWEIEGAEHFDGLKNHPVGAVVITAHMGSYDLAGPFFSERYGRPVHAVRAPERNPELQALREAQFRREQTSAYGVHFNSPGAMVGITLAQALARGEIVAVQADRMLFDIAGVEVMWKGRKAAVPKGPFVLAGTSGCPLFPLFIIRTGRRSYRIRIEAPLKCRAPSRDGREAAIRECAGLWMDRLGAVIEKHWRQWFVLEPFFQEPEHAK